MMEDEIDDSYEKSLEERGLETIATDYSPPSLSESRWIYDYTLLYWEIKAALIGGWVTEDKKGNYVIKRPKNAKPIMNSLGIEETITDINAMVTKIQALSIYTEERIFEICWSIADSIVHSLYINMERYEITPEKARKIRDIIMSLIESNMRKSIQGRSMLMIGQTERIIETRQPEKKKWFGIF